MSGFDPATPRIRIGCITPPSTRLNNENTPSLVGCALYAPVGCGSSASGRGLRVMDLLDMGRGLWVMGYGLWAAGRGLWVMDLLGTGPGLWATGYGLQLGLCGLGRGLRAWVLDTADGSSAWTSTWAGCNVPLLTNWLANENLGATEFACAYATITFQSVTHPCFLTSRSPFISATVSIGHLNHIANTPFPYNLFLGNAGETWSLRSGVRPRSAYVIRASPPR